MHPQLCLTFCDLMDCSLPGSSVHGIFQARILERVAISSSRGSPGPRDQTQVCCISYIAGGFFTAEPSGKPYFVYSSVYMRRRQRQATPVLLPGKSLGWRSLVGYSPWGYEESDTTGRLHFHFSLSCTGEELSSCLSFHTRTRAHFMKGKSPLLSNLPRATAMRPLSRRGKPMRMDS